MTKITILALCFNNIMVIVVLKFKGRNIFKYNIIIFLYYIII
jgi:hypothetical protein